MENIRHQAVDWDACVRIPSVRTVFQSWPALIRCVRGAGKKVPGEVIPAFLLFQVAPFQNLLPW